MKLSSTELNYIKYRMDTYDIKYQEIYDEINDHVTSAVETARAGGDDRNIVPLFDELVERQFPGYWAFEAISKEYEKAYRRKIKSTIWTNMKYYMDRQVTITIIILAIVGFYIPPSKILSLVFFILISLIAFVPMFYAWLKTKKMHLDEGKQSMVTGQVKLHSSLLTLLLQLMLNVFGWAGRDLHITVLEPAHYHPVVCILLLSFFIIYSLSSMRLCRQELEIETNF